MVQAVQEDEEEIEEEEGVRVRATRESIVLVESQQILQGEEDEEEMKEVDVEDQEEQEVQVQLGAVVQSIINMQLQQQHNSQNDHPMFNVHEIEDDPELLQFQRSITRGQERNTFSIYSLSILTLEQHRQISYVYWQSLEIELQRTCKITRG